jgi:GT2 family glycosyltransferase
MSFAIGIPTLNRADLLLPTLAKYVTEDFKNIEIHIIDNGKQDLSFLNVFPNVIVYEQDHNIGVAASWNKLCKIIFEKHNHALILNDDVYLGYNTDTINSVIAKYEYSLVQSYVSWSVILMSKYMYDYIGDFDETFYPAYYEDSDYLYRMKLKGIRQDVEAELNPQTARISMTQERDPELVNASMQENRLRYIEKWGNSPLLETFLTPYNK